MKNISVILLLVIPVVIACKPSEKLDSQPIESREFTDVATFSQQVKANLVFVEGGSFLMGDFGVEYGSQGLPYDFAANSKPLHPVTLSSFSIEKFKITNASYQRYLKENGLPLRSDVSLRKDWDAINSAPNTPAHLDWFEAKQYCDWLAHITGSPFALPTEAQWEYAARSRGQFLMLATDDGSYKITSEPYRENWKGGPRGINYSTTRDRKEFATKMGWGTDLVTPLPVDQYPPNSLGLYSMTDNGYEWVQDWYDPDYYKHSPVIDPQGPESPTYKDEASFNTYAKVLRGSTYRSDGYIGGINVQRNYRNPDAYRASFTSGEPSLSIWDKTARCAVNSPAPVLATVESE